MGNPEISGTDVKWPLGHYLIGQSETHPFGEAN
jgi:hypothetical protein